MRLPALAAAAVISSACFANANITLDPAGQSSPASSVTGTINGVGFTMTGFTVNDDLSNEQAAQVGWDANGYGVASNLTGQTAGDPASPANPTVAGNATIDGIGTDKNELLRIEFDTMVVVASLTFGFVDRVDDVTVRIDNGTPLRFGLGGPTGGNAGVISETLTFATPLTGTTLDIIAGFPNTTSGGGGSNDLVSFQGANVSPVPVPAALPLLAGGLALLAWVGRRRNRA